MAQRRMFSPDIVSSDTFLDMPISSQVLYFHLAMRADDDGFITPKMVMRLVGSGEDDLKVLIAKRFLLSFESGVVVVKHWLIHNLIRADLYKETLYKKEKATLGLNENGAYTELREGIAEIKKIEAPEWLKRRKGDLCTANVPQTAPRLGKDRIGKVSIPSEPKVSQDITKFIDLWKDINPAYRKFFANKTERSASTDLLKISPLGDWEIFLPLLQKMNADQYAKGKSTKPTELLRNIGYFKAWIDNKKDNKRKVVSV